VSVKRFVYDRANDALRPWGVQIVRGFTNNAGIKSFIPAKSTIARAKRERVSVTDYIDKHNATLGATEATVVAMLRLAGLGGNVQRICEIGPGTGRYAERVISALNPDVYEMYETARDWLPYLARLPGAKLQPADGYTLSATESGSVDLVHANKVFVYVPLVVTAGYLGEMSRVVRPGGAVAFDVVTDDCMDEATTEAWIAQRATLYTMLSRQWVIDFLGRRGLTLLGSSFATLSGGRTELLVFRKAR